MSRKLILSILLCLALASACTSRLQIGTAKPETIHMVLYLNHELPQNLIVETLEAWADEFHAQNPKLQVQIHAPDILEMSEQHGDDFLRVLLGEGAEADVVLGLPMGGAYSEGLILPLNPLLDVDPNLDKADFVGPLLHTLEIDNQLIGLPYWFNPQVMYCNKALFQATGVPLPQTDWTWEQFLDTAGTLRTKLGPDQFALGMGPGEVWPVIYAHGGRVVDDLDNPTQGMLDESMTRAGIYAFLNLTEQGLIPTPDQISAYQASFGKAQVGFSISRSGGTWSVADQVLWQEMADYTGWTAMAMLEGNVAIWVGPLIEGSSLRTTGSLSFFSGKDIIPGVQQPEAQVILMPRAAKPVMVIARQHTMVLSLTTASPRQEAAWQWMRFLLEKAPPVGLPARLSVLYEPGVSEQIDPDRMALAKTLEQYADDVLLLTDREFEFTDPIVFAVWRTWNGQDLDTALMDAAAQIDETLAAIQERSTAE